MRTLHVFSEDLLLTFCFKYFNVEFYRFSLSHCIKKHSCLLVSFLFYPSMLITSVTLDVLLTLGFPLATMALSDKTKIVRTFVSFLFNLLHEYKFASLEKSKIFSGFCFYRLWNITSYMVVWKKRLKVYNLNWTELN